MVPGLAGTSSFRESEFVRASLAISRVETADDRNAEPSASRSVPGRETS